MINRTVTTFASLIVFLCSCTVSSAKSNQPLPTAIQKIKIHFQEEFDLQLFVLGEGGTADRLDVLTLGFRSNRKVDVTEARRLIISCVNDTLGILNHQPGLSDLLANAPAGPQILNLEIYFYRTDEAIFRKPNVGIVASDEGIIKYFYKKDEQEFGYSRIDEETFEEAVAKVRETERAI